MDTEKIVHLVHGFNVADGGKKTIDTLIPHLEKKGYIVKQFDYGWAGLLGVRFFNKKRAKKFMEQVSSKDIVVGHSNGCAIIALALEMNMWANKVIFIHPALNNNWSPPIFSTKYIRVYYSAKDKATWAAKFLINHIWGDMGTIGPKSNWRGWIPIDDGMEHSEGFHKNPAMYLRGL